MDKVLLHFTSICEQCIVVKGNTDIPMKNHQYTALTLSDILNPQSFSGNNDTTKYPQTPMTQLLDPDILSMSTITLLDLNLLFKEY